MRGRGKSSVFRFSRFFALAVLIVGGAVFITGCEKEKQEISRAPIPTPTPCTSIDPPAFRNQASTTPLARREVCVPVGECIATNANTKSKIAENYCNQFYTSTCRPGSCSSRSCKPAFDSGNSTGVNIAACASGAAGPPACAAGEELCKCDLSVAPRGVLDCDCGCR